MTNKKMPELAKPWVALYGDGGLWGRWATRSDAERGHEHAARNNAYLGPHTIVRLAVVEVVEPEPEAAPGGWAYRVRVSGNRSWVQRKSANGLWTLLFRTTNDNWRAIVPPIDHDHVRKLIEGAK